MIEFISFCIVSAFSFKVGVIVGDKQAVDRFKGIERLKKRDINNQAFSLKPDEMEAARQFLERERNSDQSEK